MDLAPIIAELRAHGGDLSHVEANLPGGGLLIVGLDEAHGFRPVGLNNAQEPCGIGSHARHQRERIAQAAQTLARCRTRHPTRGRWPAYDVPARSDWSQSEGVAARESTPAHYVDDL